MTAGTESDATDLYTAEVDREDGWWTIHVLPLDVVTQASRWSEVEEMARGVVIAVPSSLSSFQCPRCPKLRCGRCVPGWTA